MKCQKVLQYKLPSQTEIMLIVADAWGFFFFFFGLVGVFVFCITSLRWRRYSCKIVPSSALWMTRIGSPSWTLGTTVAKAVMAGCRFHLWISPITRIDVVIGHTWVDTWQYIAIDANGQPALFLLPQSYWQRSESLK